MFGLLFCNAQIFDNSLIPFMTDLQHPARDWLVECEESSAFGQSRSARDVHRRSAGLVNLTNWRGGSRLPFSRNRIMSDVCVTLRERGNGQ